MLEHKQVVVEDLLGPIRRSRSSATRWSSIASFVVANSGRDRGGMTALRQAAPSRKAGR